MTKGGRIGAAASSVRHISSVRDANIPTYAVTAVIRIDTRMPGSSTPSFATYRVGPPDGNQRAHFSFSPEKSSGWVSRTPDVDGILQARIGGLEDRFAVRERLPRLVLDGEVSRVHPAS